VKTFLYGFASGAFLLGLCAIIVTGLQRAEANARIDVANVAAEHFQIAYIEMVGAYEERAFVEKSQKELRKQLEADNEELARLVRDRDARIVSLEHTTTSLEARLDSSATTVDVEPDGTYTVDLDESVVLDSGGYVRVLGTLSLETVGPSVTTDLSVLGSFPLSVVITEQPNGELAVFAYTGDDRLRVTTVDVTTAPVRGTSSVWSDIMGALRSPTPWIGAAAGVAGCLLLTGGF
jgi:type II secretory pathway pseudopilin PulG